MSDGMSVISVTYCTCVVYIISDLRTFNFLHTKAIDCWSEYFVYFPATRRVWVPYTLA